MIDERICGNRSPKGITCLLLPGHPTPSCAGLDENYSMVLWPRDENYEPQHHMRIDDKNGQE